MGTDKKASEDKNKQTNNRPAILTNRPPMRVTTRGVSSVTTALAACGKPAPTPKALAVATAAPPLMKSCSVCRLETSGPLFGGDVENADADTINNDHAATKQATEREVDIGDILVVFFF
jgi:hypothetical protein